MNFLNGITLLLVYQLAGEIIVRLLGVSIPGPVLGMVMLFITMMIRGRRPRLLNRPLRHC
nr:CidA/LrgA family protein [Marinobacter sp. AC-23]